MRERGRNKHPPEYVWQVILDAFSDTPIPSVLTESIPAEDVEPFIGKKWQELDTNFLLANRGATALFTPEAFRYFFPAYCRVAIFDYDNGDTVPGEIVFILTPPRYIKECRKDKGISALFTELFKSISLDQKKAICVFLEYLCSKHPDDYPSNILNPVITFWTEMVQRS